MEMNTRLRRCVLLYMGTKQHQNTTHGICEHIRWSVADAPKQVLSLFTVMQLLVNSVSYACYGNIQDLLQDIISFPRE